LCSDIPRVKESLNRFYIYVILYNFATLVQLSKLSIAIPIIMKQFIFLVFSISVLSFSGNAQDLVEVRKNTLDDQMTEAFEKSNSYQEYKVVKKTQLASIRRNVLDSISSLKKDIETQKSELNKRKSKIDSLHNSLRITQEDLELAKEKEEGIEVFGILTTKSTYNTFMWSIIGALSLIGGFLFYRFINSHKIINAAQLKIAELEIEIEDYRRNSLEREQKLRRKLQDEINKNRKV